MFKYTSQNQLSIFEFKTEFESKLNPENRWVLFSKLLDWDSLASIYCKQMDSEKGAPSVDARIVIGALIIKHIERKDDRGTIEAIKENPYMQFFLGLDCFTFDAVFDPSLFVHIRKRIGMLEFDKMNDIILEKALEIDKQFNTDDSKIPKDEKHEQSTEKKKSNKGKMQMDATITDANIKHPTDLNLVNESREITEKLIDKFAKLLELKQKPRTYRRNARKAYLNLAKKKSKSIKEIKKGVKQQLNYLSRNLKHIHKILDTNKDSLQLLNKKEYKYFLVVQEHYRQQKQMSDNKTSSVQNRIVSIHQPHVRPMVRGKDGKKVEFGAKINISLLNGYGRIDQQNFEAFNEGKYLKEQVEKYKKLRGYYPEVVQTDDIYMTRENRNYLKENGIRHTGKPLGRKPKIEMNRYQKAKLKFERNQRNQIEGKFGQGKRKYGLNKIMAKSKQTSESWIYAIIFVMNILKLSKDFLCQYFLDCIRGVMNLKFSISIETIKNKQFHFMKFDPKIQVC